jgi:hypothetical protein
MIYYTVYKTINILNNYEYIGMHKTDNLNDGYIGSGIYLNRAIDKHKIENFKKEIIFIFDNESDMRNKEKELVNEQYILRQDTYNIALGGKGGLIFQIGTKEYDIWRTKILNSLPQCGDKDSEEYKTFIENTINGMPQCKDKDSDEYKTWQVKHHEGTDYLRDKDCEKYKEWDIKNKIGRQIGNETFKRNNSGVGSKNGKWVDVDMNLLLKLKQDGLSIPAISKQMCVSISTIIRRIKSLEIDK